MRSGRHQWMAHLLVLLLYLILSLALTWPLAMHLSTHVPGDGGDDPALAWNLWWVKYALVDLGMNPFDCTHMFHPLGINLAFYTLTVLNGTLSIPLQGILGLVTVSNLILLSSYVLGGFGAYLLALNLLRRHGRGRSLSHTGIRTAAIFAGMVYAFSSSKLFYASLGQFNIASNQWIPFYALMLLRMGQQPAHWRYPLLAGVFLLLQAWAEMTYASFLIVFTTIFLLLRLIERWRSGHLGRRQITPLIGGTMILALITLIGISPLITQMLPDMRIEGDFWMEGTGFAEEFSADPLGLFIPTRLHPWLGGPVGQMGFPHTLAQHYYIGYVVLALALLGLYTGWRRQDTRFWALSAGLFLLLALGPTLRFNGQDLGIALPFRIFQELPFFKGNRYPSRYGVLLVLSLAMLAGLGMAWLHGRLSRPSRPWSRLVPAGLAAVFILEHLSIPLPLSDLRVPAAYAQITDTGDYALLDLPIAWRNGFRVTGIMDPIFMYAQFYQTQHHKRLLGGNTSRNPEIKFQYFTEAPVLNSIIALENGHTLSPETWQADHSVAHDLLRFFDIRYVMLHVPTAGPALRDYVEGVLPLEPLYHDDIYRLYGVRAHPRTDWEPQDSSPDEPLGRLALAEGWSIPGVGSVWAQAPQARILAQAGAGEGVLHLRLRAPGQQVLAIRLNDCHLGQIEIGPESGDYMWPIPAGCGAPTLSSIYLSATTPFSPEEAREPTVDRPIGLTGAHAPVEITVQSAGKEVGDFGHITLDGMLTAGQRGYHLMAIDAETGEVIGRGVFDTHLAPAANRDLAEFVAELQEGTIVAVAAMDEASMHLGEEAVRALRELGLAGDLRGGFRWSHAAIGVKGAPPGTAVEALHAHAPVTAVVGRGLTRPQAYFELQAWYVRSAR